MAEEGPILPWPPSSFAKDFGPPPGKGKQFLVLIFPISVLILLRM